MSTKEKIMARLKEVADKNPSDPDSWYKDVEPQLRQLIFVGKSRAYFRIHKIDVGRQVKRYTKFLKESVEQLKDIHKDSATRNIVFCAHSKVKFAESVGIGQIHIERKGPFVLSTSTKVHYAVVESESSKCPATAGKDFATSDGWIEFLPGDTEKVIEVKIFDDPDFEEDEEFVVKLFDIQESSTDSLKSYVVRIKKFKEFVKCKVNETVFAGAQNFENRNRLRHHRRRPSWQVWIHGNSSYS